MRNGLKMVEKNRNRSLYTFANINLMGVCNYNCYFCVGKDIEKLVENQDQLTIHYEKWNYFQNFLKICEDLNITQLYITGLNTDPLLYMYLNELIRYLKNEGFFVGLRTNGRLALSHMNTINLCTTGFGDAVGYSMVSLDKVIHQKITGDSYIPDWGNIFSQTKVPFRVSIVVNRYNKAEISRLIKF